LKLGKYDLDIDEFEITTHTGNHPSRGDGDVYWSDIEYVQGVVHCSLGYGVTCDFKVALKQWKRLTYPPMNENGLTNSNYRIDSGSGGNNNRSLTLHSPSTFPGSDVDNNSLLNEKSLFLGVGCIRHYYFK